MRFSIPSNLFFPIFFLLVFARGLRGLLPDPPMSFGLFSKACQSESEQLCSNLLCLSRHFSQVWMILLLYFSLHVFVLGHQLLTLFVSLAVVTSLTTSTTEMISTAGMSHFQCTFIGVSEEIICCDLCLFYSPVVKYTQTDNTM